MKGFLNATTAPNLNRAKGQLARVARLRKRPGVLLSAAFLLLLLFVAFTHRWITPFAPNEQLFARALASPNADHLLGTDEFGRDTLSRLMAATEVTVMAPLIAVGVAVAIGVPLGLMAGFLGRRVDWLLSRAADALLAIPSIALAIAVVAVFGPNLVNSMTAVGLVFAPRLFRVVRGSVISIRHELFVDSARSIGSGVGRILFVHVLPNIASPLLVQVTLMMGFAVLAEASLSFLGLAVQPPDASWGSMMRAAYENQYQAPFQIIPAGVAMSLTILSFNTIGDSLRDAIAGRRVR